MKTKEVYCSLPTYVWLEHVLGATQATQTTIDLFNSVRSVEQDEHGTYSLKAIRAYKNGLFISKIYYTEV